MNNQNYPNKCWSCLKSQRHDNTGVALLLSDSGSIVTSSVKTRLLNEILSSLFTSPTYQALGLAHTQKLRLAHTQTLGLAHTQTLGLAHTKTLGLAHTQTLGLTHT